MASEPCPLSVRVIGILSIVLGTTLIMAGFGTMMGAFSQFPQGSDEVFAFWFSIGGFFAVGVVSIVLAAGLIEGKRWGWFGAMALCLLAFLKFPVGTILGAIVMAFLLKSGARAYFKIGACRRPAAD